MAKSVAATLVAVLVLCVPCRGQVENIKRDPGLIQVRLDVPKDINWDDVDITWEAKEPYDLKYYVYENGAVITFCSQTDVVLMSDIINWSLRKREKTTWKVDVGEPPKPPNPPNPPNPPPTDVPFPAPGLTVLIIREAGDTISLPVAQRAILTSSQVMGWLRDHCVKLSDGFPAARVWDDDYTDSQLSNSQEVLRTAYRELLKQANGRLPWIGISDGKKGFSGPLPNSIGETMQLLQKFAN